MIVKQRKEVPAFYLYGVGGAVALIMVGIVSMRSAFVPTVITACDTRYHQGVRFSWAKPSGEAMTADELQGKLGGRDWGLLQNVRIGEMQGAPAPIVLEVGLRIPAPLNSEARDNGIDTGKSGMGFVWQPSALAKAQAGCLSYSIWMPADFDFGTGGVLPGLFADEPEANPEAAPNARKARAFATRLYWRPDGRVDSLPFSQEGMEEIVINQKLERGRWIKIDQEFELNTPNVADGTLRVWIDGELGLERRNMNYRAAPEQTMTAVAADVHYTDEKRKWAPAAKSGRMRLSPIEVRLR